MREPEGRICRGAAAVLALLVALVRLSPALAGAAASEPPATLRDTGLYADFAARVVDPRNLAFAPQYPLWTDGATKRRWISLPPGTAIDASDPENWVFPAGTRLWKEFAFGGRPVETRMIERLADGSWRYAAYAWSADGSAATLAPAAGLRASYDLGGGRWHAIPSVGDCKVCHEGRPSPIIGFSLLQLSPDRDPNAPYADPPPAPGVDLPYLVRAGLLTGLPQALLDHPPRIEAASPAERAALGYLHGNCGQCHASDGKLANIGLYLRHMNADPVEDAVASTVDRPVKAPAPGQTPDSRFRVEPGHPERSVLFERMASRWAAAQMPPLGTELVDEDALGLVRQWIDGLDANETTQAQQGGTRQ
ncbi:MAG: hypothetical protein U1E40_02730 [Amaricoccus sp.]